jgi:hypothetical protein
MEELICVLDTCTPLLLMKLAVHLKFVRIKCAHLNQDVSKAA